MIANLILLLFLIFMVYWWGLRQGFFSAWLHLMITVIAGSLALGLWEVVAGILLPFLTSYAWGIGLLVPFIFCLIIARKVADKRLPNTPKLHPIVNNLGGGICGMLAGVVSAGITVIGINYLPLPVGAGGYQPAVVDHQGRVVRDPDGDLWVPVDRWTGGFYQWLSEGSLFASGGGLGGNIPDLDDQAILYRMRYDPNSSLAVPPGAVEVRRSYLSEIGEDRFPLGFLSELIDIPRKNIPTGSNPSEDNPISTDVADERLPEGHPLRNKRLALIETRWTQTEGSYDDDGILRVPPTQVRLIVSQGRERSKSRSVAPIGWTRMDDRTPGFFFSRFDTDTSSGYGLKQQERLGWVFLLEGDQTPRSILIRRLRLGVPSPEDNPKVLMTRMGYTRGDALLPVPDLAPDPDNDQEAPTSDGGSPNSGVGLMVSERIPIPLSKNRAVNLRVQDQTILDGRMSIEHSGSLGIAAERIDRIYAPAHQLAVRLRLDGQWIRENIGGSQVSATMQQGVWIENDSGQRWDPVGYIWVKARGVQFISIDRNQPIHSLGELPVDRIKANEKLYLYYMVEKGVTVTSCQLGGHRLEGLNLSVTR